MAKILSKWIGLGIAVRHCSRRPFTLSIFRFFASAGLEREEFDLIVIGGGSGGLACSKEAASLGASVAVVDFVETSPRGTTWGLGGTCVNVGCIPKKLFHHGASLGASLQDAKLYGWKLADNTTHDWDVLRTGVANYIKSLNFEHRVQLRKRNIKYYNAKASFSDQHTIRIEDKKETVKELTAKNFVIAVGGRPKYPDIPGAKEYGISSDDIFSLKLPPGKTLIIGAGYIALECASFLRGLGFDVTVMVRSICLRKFDQDMAHILADSLAYEGIQFIHGAVPSELQQESSHNKLRKESSHIVVKWQDQEGNGEDVFNTVLFAIGRVPNSHTLDLRKIGVEVDPRSGKIMAKAEQTSVSHIYAIGDILTGKPELTPVAIKAGKLLARRIFKKSEQEMDYENVATTVFTSPEYACVGQSEEKAIETFGPDNVEVYHSYYVPLEFTVAKRNADYCYMKVVCLQEHPQTVLGIHLIGPNAGEIIQGFSAAMRCGLTWKVLNETVGVHPTIAEDLLRMNVTKSSGIDPKPTTC